MKVKIIAHRGASKEAPENTLASLKIAQKIGVDCVEFDVHLSKDGVPIVIHDLVPFKTSQGVCIKKVTDCTLEELKQLDVGSWFSQEFKGVSIPTLQEILTQLYPMPLMIELKKGPTPIKLLVKAVLKELEKVDCQHLLIGSFSLPLLIAIKQANPLLSLIGIAEDFNTLPLLTSLNLTKVAIWYKLINPSTLQPFHQAQLPVWAFTVDDLQVARHLISLGVEGLITNDPKQFIHSTFIE